MNQAGSKDSMLEGTAGVDEAGRGPMIGPLVVCGVLFDSEAIPDLKRLGVRDSKTLTPKRRSELAASVQTMAKKVEIRSVTAEEIDRLRGRGVSLNEIEVQQFVSVLKELSPKVAYLDAADVKADRFGQAVGERSGLLALGCNLISEHKADAKYPVVSAASILAKEQRETIISNLHERHGDFGSGYPNDPKSVRFVQSIADEGREIPSIVRKSWESVRRILNNTVTMQSTLDD